MGPLLPPAVTTTTARRQGSPVGRRARGTWTATVGYVQKTLHLGTLLLATQDDRSLYARDERSGMLVLPSASCSATPQRRQPKPQQPDMSAPGDASLLSICQPRALHLTSIVSLAARACLGTVSAPFFRCFRPARNSAPGQAYWNRDGIISNQESPFFRFAEGPRTSC